MDSQNRKTKTYNSIRFIDDAIIETTIIHLDSFHDTKYIRFERSFIYLLIIFILFKQEKMKFTKN